MENVKELHTLIKRRRRQIMVHSFGYYRMNDNLVSDEVYDNWCYELVKLQNEHPKISSEVELYEEFKDFSGESGFDLPLGEPWIAVVWNRLVKHKQ